jgi:hypothetical protein
MPTAIRAVPHVPASKLPGTYKSAPKLWRHSLHTMCSRVAMFPPQLTHYFIELYSRQNEVVADPWAGVGTVPLQAGLDGRVGYGSDISPEAWTVMSAKLHPIPADEVSLYLEEVSARMKRMKKERLDDIGARIGIQHYYDGRTLQEILKIRTLLRGDRNSKYGSLRRKAVFLTALMLGILHGDREESLSLEMDSSKAYSPVHIKAMQRKFPGRYCPKYRNVIHSLRTKTNKVLKDDVPRIEGVAYKMDVKDFRANRAASLIITSPPYLDVHEYAYDNRVRLWFLDYDHTSVNKSIFSSGSLARYFDYVGNALRQLSKSMSRNSRCVLMLGDVRRDQKIIKVGELFAKYWLKQSSVSMQLEQIIVDRVRPTRRRYFNLKKSQGIRCERILIFRKGNPVTRKVSFDWSRLNGEIGSAKIHL